MITIAVRRLIPGLLLRDIRGVAVIIAASTTTPY